MKKLTKIIITTAATFTINTAVSANSAPHTLILHSGPGNHYPVKATIAAGTSIKFGVCNLVWCHIYAGELKGWIPTKAIVPQPEEFAYNYRKSRNRSFGSTTGSSLKANTLTIRLKIVRR